MAGPAPPHGAIPSPNANFSDPTSGAPVSAWYSFLFNLGGQNFGPQPINAVFAGPSSGNSAPPTFRAIVDSDLTQVVGLTGSNFPTETANTFFVGPVDGGSGASPIKATPTWRTLVSNDLLSVAGIIPGVSNGTPAPIGDVGEYISQTITFGSAVPLTSTVPADIAFITLTAGDWDVWGSISTRPSGGAQQLNVRGWLGLNKGQDPGPPNGGAYVDHPFASDLFSVTLPVGMMTVAPFGQTIVYLISRVDYTGGNVGVYGFIGARRRR